MSVIDQVLAAQTQLQKAKPLLNSLKKSTDGMEASFVKQMVTQMRKSAGDVHFGEELGGEMYRDMFDQTIADTLTQNGNLGLSKAMFASLAPQVLNHKVSNGTAVQSTASTDLEEKTD